MIWINLKFHDNGWAMSNLAWGNDYKLADIFFLILHLPLFHEGWVCSSSWLSRQTSRSSITSSVGRIFKKRRPENLKIMKTKSKISPLKISPVFGPKLGEGQKKDLHPNSVLFVCSNFLPKLQKKGPWHHAPPLNTSLSIIIISLGWSPERFYIRSQCNWSIYF